VAERLRIKAIYPDYDDENDYIIHTNKGTFLLSKDELKKIVDVIL